MHEFDGLQKEQNNQDITKQQFEIAPAYALVARSVIAN
jgi:hypothetical protein